MEFMLPIKGESQGFGVDKAPPLTSGYLNNVRPVDVLEKRVRLGQRPGLKKLYSQQIGGDAKPVVAICSITVVD